MYDYVVYVDPNGPVAWNTLRDEIESLRDYFWQRTALVRWRYADPHRVGDVLSANDILIVLDWPADDAGANRASEIFRHLRSHAIRTPVLIVNRGYTHSVGGSRRSIVDLFCLPGGRCYEIPQGDLYQPEVVATALQRLDVSLRGPTLRLEGTPNNLETEALVKWIGEDLLTLTVQKFFPAAEGKEARIWPVGGGWSTVPLCEVFLEEEGPHSHFLKFFGRQPEQSSERAQHRRAKDWLGGYLADLRPVPEMEDEDSAQIQAFPPCTPPVYPVCYVSASNDDCPRETLKRIYQSKEGPFVEQTVETLLQVLASGQQDAPRARRAPWAFSESSTGAEVFVLTLARKRAVAGVAEDLAPYTRALRGRGCRGCVQETRNLLDHPPRWLEQPRPVATGHVHGDPNPRNCLVNREESSDLQLIDAGGYAAQGRLVSDLAIIERDIKLVLLATEHDAPGFLDLDVTELQTWCEAERKAICQGIGFDVHEIEGSPWWRRRPSAERAYRLVARVRREAKRVCGTDDSRGIHYFAALLFWTLDALRYEMVRPTKKLLALCSAAEILRLFA